MSAASDNPRNPDGTFKKGFTGNRKGAPQKSKRRRPVMAIDILSDEAFDHIARDLPDDLGPEDEAAYRTFQAACSGSKRAIRTILKHIVRREEERRRLGAEGDFKSPVKIVAQMLHPKSADAAMLILQIAEMGGSRLKLSSWAVQSAISRRHGGTRLGPNDILLINGLTANSDDLRWPRDY